jgi:DNA invertase Pin-like site-specific DNA recombinase
VRAIGYLRVSTAEQAESGAGLAAQRWEIERAAGARGWTEVRWAVDLGASGKSMARRSGLAGALGSLGQREADILVVAKLDRLSRSVADFAHLLDRAGREGWGLVALDLGVDTTTPAGELVANVMAAVAQWERKAIGMRTKEGLAVRRAEGVRLGRPPVLPRAVVEDIVSRREAGHTFAAIADELERSGVPTARGGGQWWPSTVRSVLESQHVRSLDR